MKVLGLVMIWSHVLWHHAILQGDRDKNKEKEEEEEEEKKNKEERRIRGGNKIQYIHYGIKRKIFCTRLSFW